MKVIEELMQLQDKDYGDFQSKLIPDMPREKLIGVRTPDVRKLAKAFAKDPECQQFLNALPHNYYEEYILHGILISEMKDYDQCITYLENFLPYVDNWAVCDLMNPKPFKNNRDKLLEKIKVWIKSKHTYTCRFAMLMLMKHFLDEDFKSEYLKMPASVHSDEYYVNMMIAWYFATALAKQWDATIPYFEQPVMDKWTHNKAIQKARESYRVTKEQKEYLKTLKIK